jgi:hypothetical protein
MDRPFSPSAPCGEASRCAIVFPQHAAPSIAPASHAAMIAAGLAITSVTSLTSMPISLIAARRM